MTEGCLSLIQSDLLIEFESIVLRAEDDRENAMHVIAVDAMGGDNAPQPIVEELTKL